MLHVLWRESNKKKLLEGKKWNKTFSLIVISVQIAFDTKTTKKIIYNLQNKLREEKTYIVHFSMLI